ncbi:MAG TPA: GNAT family N-acetyltransferase [Pseudonocardiaceae bacterium]|jgi:GNAT superfamily N-acetyltransferase|nr:GNAT family N-acetyltransferase [Pseudonocardiaceae bacterium]
MLVTTTYLEMTSPTDLRPAKPPAEPGRVVRVDEVSPEFCRFLYAAVGGDWFWLQRLAWTYDEWTAWLSRPGAETWVSWLHGTPTGFIELDAQPGAASTQVEIAYFGLLPRFIGRGLGGQLLTAGIANAWSLRARWPELPPVDRVWVHTCTLDGEHALANYTARGLRAYRTTQQEEHLPPRSPGPWPGARPDQ